MTSEVDVESFNDVELESKTVSNRQESTFHIQEEEKRQREEKAIDIKKDYFEQLRLHEKMLKLQQIIKAKYNADTLRIDNVQLKLQRVQS